MGTQSTWGEVRERSERNKNVHDVVTCAPSGSGDYKYAHCLSGKRCNSSIGVTYDSLGLPAYQKIQSTMEVLEKSFKEMTVIEKKHKKGVTWKDFETGTQEEEKEEQMKQSDITYVMEDDNYRSALKIVNNALETLLDMKINTVNM